MLDNKESLPNEIEKTIAAPELQQHATIVESKYATTTSSVLGLINSMIGAGLITLPQAFYAAGLIQGTLLAFIAGLFSIFSLHLVVLVAYKGLGGGRDTSFAKACIKYMPRAKIFVDFVIVLNTFGTATSYPILVGKVLPSICSNLSALSGGQAPLLLTSRIFWITIFIFVICLPLCLLKHLRSLRYASMLAVGMIGYITLFVITCGVIKLSQPTNGLSFTERMDVSLWQPSFFGFLKCLSFLLFAYVCQFNMFTSYNEMSNPSIKKGTFIAFAATMATAIIYTLVGLMGYFALGSDAGGNLFDMLEHGHFGPTLAKYDGSYYSVVIAQLCIVFLVTTCYPVQVHPCREALLEFLKSAKLLLSGSKIDTEQNIKPISSSDDLKRTLATIFLVLVSYGIALGVTDFGGVVSIVGSTGSNLIAFIFPSLLYLMMEKKEPWSVKKCLALGLLVFGAVFMIAMFVSDGLGQ